MGKPRATHEGRLTRIIFECLRWGPVRPRDIFIAAGYQKRDRFDVVVRRLRELEQRGILYATPQVIYGCYGGNNAMFYQLDYDERIRRYGQAEPWTVQRQHG